MHFTLFIDLIRKPADIWSAGVLLHLLLSGTLPFMGTKDRLYNQILEAQIDLEGPLWDKIGPDAKDLLRKMLTRDPDKRITIHEVLSHPWLKVLRCTEPCAYFYYCHWQSHLLFSTISFRTERNVRGTIYMKLCKI